MSDNKRQKIELRSDSKKSSFDERVCDDLCEVLLQYLPFEDKFKLECVSKQFQRNVFNREYELVFDNSMIGRNFGNRLTFNTTSFETIIKKCPNIKTINLMNYFSSNHNSSVIEKNKIVDIIIENCDHLKHFQLYPNNLTPKTIEKFCQKLSTKLSSIRFLHWDQFFDRQLLTSLSNITDISLENFAQFFDNENQCLVKNVGRLSILYDENDLKLFETLIDSNRSLNNLEIICPNMDQPLLCQLLSKLSILSDLRQLNLQTLFFLTDNSFAKWLILMAHNCPNLKNIRMPSIHLEDNTIESHGLVLEIIDSLKHFKQLKRILVNLPNVCPTLLTAKHLSVCKELTDLTLCLKEVDDSFFKDIGAHMPGLRYLHIMNANISESTLQELAQLKNLEKLIFDHGHHSMVKSKFNDKSIAQMYVKCPKLKSIKL